MVCEHAASVAHASVDPWQCNLCSTRTPMWFEAFQLLEASNGAKKITVSQSLARYLACGPALQPCNQLISRKLCCHSTILTHQAMKLLLLALAAMPQAPWPAQYPAKRPSTQQPVLQPSSRNPPHLPMLLGP